MKFPFYTKKKQKNKKKQKILFRFFEGGVKRKCKRDETGLE